MTEIYNAGNPYDVVRTSDGQYQASDGELVITDADTLQLPEPADGEYVLVKRAGVDYVDISTPVGNVGQIGEEARFDGDDAVMFVSDGSDWYIRSDTLQLGVGIPDSGISRYAFEQDFADSWGDNDATGVNSPQFTTNAAVGDYAIDLTGSEWVDIGTPASLAFTASDAFSIAVWVEADAWDGPDSRSHWVSSRNGNQNYSSIWSLDSSDLRWTVNGDSNKSEVITTPPSTGSYVLLVGTYDGGGNTELYFNDANSQGTASASLTGDVYGYWNVGQREDLDRRPVGRIDDPRFYGKELSASEVSNLYDTGSI